MIDELHRPTVRVIAILECLAKSAEGLTLTEISAFIGSSKGTIFPIMKTLVAYKYAQIDDALRYSLGFRSCLLASSFSHANPWLALIHNEMQNIVDCCEEVCQLGVLDGNCILYIDKVQSKRAVQLVSHIGKRLSATKTALGKSLLSDFNNEYIIKIFDSSSNISDPSQRKTQLDKLLSEIELVRAHGYAVDDREINEETKCYAVSLYQGEIPIAALSVSLPYFRDTEQISANILKLLFNKKQFIENAFNAYVGQISLITK